MGINRWLTLLAAMLALFTFAMWRQGGGQAVALAGPDPQPAAANGLKAVTIVFGEKDAQPASWDGAASISAGRIERIAGYHFTEACKVDGSAWTCATHPWTPFQQGMNPRERPQPHATPLEPVESQSTFKRRPTRRSA
jgi:hypothetical protein